MSEHQEELLFIQSIGILRVIQHVEEAAACAQFHDDHLPVTLLLLTIKYSHVSVSLMHHNRKYITSK